MAGKLAAVTRGLQLNAVTVEMEAEFDDGATMGLGNATAAPLDTRLRILVDTVASPTVVSEVVAIALESDIWFLALRDPQRISYEVIVE